MTQPLRTPSAPVFAIPAWLRPERLPVRRQSPVPEDNQEQLIDDSATHRAMLAILANGVFAATSAWLQYGALDRYQLGFLFPYYGWIGKALFGTMLGLAWLSPNRRAQLVAGLSLGLMAATEVLYALRLPVPPSSLIRLPFAALLLTIPALWLYRRWRRQRNLPTR